MKLLNPLAILHIGLFTFDVFSKFSIAKDYLEVATLQNSKEGLPIGARAFHGYCSNFMLS